MTHVCYVIPTLGIGGTERQLTILIAGLAKDHQITVLCTRHDGALAGDARRAGAQVLMLGLRSGWDPRLRGRLRDVLTMRRPDIVHTFLFGFDWFANLAARDAGVPIVVSSRRQLATWKRARHLFIQNRANRLVDCVVANSHAVADYAMAQERLDPDRVRVIYNGIDADTFLSTTDERQLRLRYRIPFNTCVIGMVANFSPVKDHALFVDAAAALLKRRADLHFLMVGSGPLLVETERRIRRLGILEGFTRQTTVAELPDLYRLMSVSVLCSRVEGFPNVVIESMAAGVPVVAAAVGGIKELVRHGETGRLVETRDPEAFAGAIEWTLEHAGEARAMADRAGRFVRTELTVDRMVESYRRLYAELLGEAGGREPNAQGLPAFSRKD